MSEFLQNRFVLLLSAIVCFVAAFVISEKGKKDFSSAAIHFEKVLDKKEEHAQKELLQLAEQAKKNSYKEIFSEKPQYYESLFAREGLVFLIFEKDSLRFWTDNTVEVENSLSQNNFNNKIILLPNGWFEVEKMSSAGKKLFALILLKREYAYQNKYLTNEFQKEFNISQDVELKVDADKIGQKHKKDQSVAVGDVYESEGEYLCTLVFPPVNSASSFAFYFSIILNLLGFVFSVWFLQLEVDSLRDKIGKWWSVLLLTLTVGVLRYLTIGIDFPKVFYESHLFNPDLYGDASFLALSSLGDLLINTALFFYLAFYFYRTVSGSKKENEFLVFDAEKQYPEVVKWVMQFFLLSIFLFASRIINYVLISLISNSNIPFALNDIFSHNIFTYAALLIFGLLFISYFLIASKLIDLIREWKLSKRQNFIVSIAAVVLFVGVSFLQGSADSILVLWPALLFASVVWAKEKKTSF
ncbi:MAG TPA: hypothetical protein VII99_08255, partial [Bacteroidia bacterium]